MNLQNSTNKQYAKTPRNFMHVKRWYAALLLCLSPFFVWAGPGHDHGEPAAPAQGLTTPRVSTHSDLFELVGVVVHDKMTIYLDRFATNEPITQATIELEIAQEKSPLKLVAKAESDGTFSVTHPLLESAGTYALSFTVTTSDDADLLAGELTIAPDPIAAKAHNHAEHSAMSHWIGPIAIAMTAIVALIGIALLLRRQKKKSGYLRSPTISVFAAAILVLSQLQPTLAFAGPGHDHGDASPAPSSNAPKRQADGSVFLPKQTQRQLSVRTVLAKQESAPQTIELLGRVITDPNAGGKVQSTQSGRIEASARGLPNLGQAVRKGEVLAVVRPSISAIERANQGALSADLKSNLELARKRLARLEQLEGVVPQKDIDAARADVQSLSQRLALVAPSASTVEALVAPVSGVIAATNVVAGQVVDAREVLFVIVDPSRLMIEATAFDSAIVNNIGTATISLPNNRSLSLRFVGAGRTLREGAMPLQFRADNGAGVVFAEGQSVKLIVQTKTRLNGFIVANEAIVKNQSNQDIIWVHTDEEQFAPRVVRWQALDGSRLLISEGLKGDERIVNQGAALLNQVR